MFMLLYLSPAIIGDPKYGVKTDRECFDNIIKHSPTPPALALNLIPKEVQCISNINGKNGKMPLNKSVLAAIESKNDHSFTLEVPRVTNVRFIFTIQILIKRNDYKN